MNRQMLAFATVLVTIVAIGLPLLPELFLPKRWLEIRLGQNRAVVHAALGVPDAEFSVKNYDGWHNPFGLGASVLIVHHDDRLAKVVTTEIIAMKIGNTLMV